LAARANSVSVDATQTLAQIANRAAPDVTTVYRNDR
jgi:hypothetical protein